MPTNKNAILRYRILDEILSDSHHYYDMTEIVRMVNQKLEKDGFSMVTRRTIEADLNAIEYDVFHAPIKRFSYAGKRCVCYEKPGFSVFHKELTKEETQLLGEVIQTIGQFDGLPHFKWLDNLQTGLAKDASKKCIVFSSNPRLKNVHLLAELYDSIVNGQVLDLSYLRFGRVQIDCFVIHPYFLREYRNRWYLIGMDQADKKVKHLAIDRIQEFVPNLDMTIEPCTFEIEEHFKDAIGITVWDDVSPQEILFWVSDSEAEYVETKPIHASQKKITGAEQKQRLLQSYNKTSGEFFSMCCQESYELDRELISHFSEMEVLLPATLRERVKQKIVGMYQIYSD